MLKESLANALYDPAMDLALEEERVDGAAEIVDNGVALDYDAAGIGIDLDLGDVAAVGEGLSWRYAVMRRIKPRLHACRQFRGIARRPGPRADCPIGDLARDHRAGEEGEPHAARMGELLRSRHRHHGVPGDRQLHRCAVAPVVALQAQGQATQGRSVSTLAPLRALWARTPVPAWARRAVGEGVKSCPRAGCGKSACPVR